MAYWPGDWGLGWSIFAGIAGFAVFQGGGGFILQRKVKRAPWKRQRKADPKRRKADSLSAIVHIKKAHFSRSISLEKRVLNFKSYKKLPV